MKACRNAREGIVVASKLLMILYNQESNSQIFSLKIPLCPENCELFM